MERDPMEMVLSTDLVMDIVLSHLKVRDLLSCRKVSKFWNKAASSVLRKRSTMMKNISTKQDLMKLQKCIMLNSDFPFAGLKLSLPRRSYSDDAKKFFENYGERFTRLRLETQRTGLDEPAPFVIHLPRLRILEVDWPFLVQDYCHRHVRLSASAARRELGIVLKLPSVRVIRIFPDYAGTEGILNEFVTATSPSVQIECPDARPEILRTLTRGGKLQAVSFMKFNASYRSKLIPEMDKLLSVGSPSLSELEFTVNGRLSVDVLKKILVSSQHTLKEMYLDRLSPSESPWENLPVLAKLTKLSLRFTPDCSHGSLFQGGHGSMFPALKELHLYLKTYRGNRNVERGPSGLFVVPSVKSIDMEGYVDEDGMEQLAQSFPSVTEISLDYSSYVKGRGWSRNPAPFEMWSVGNFKFLEKLRIWNVGFRPHNPAWRLSFRTQPNLSMDNFLTGIPVEICEDLHEQMQLGSMDSPPREVVRNKPSILQLENLKELVVCVDPEFLDALKLNVSPFISMVSVRYALDMMPNLQAKFFYHHHRLHEESYSAIMEAAFKHVQPSIKVEPFFY